jgi:hypothetical protein
VTSVVTVFAIINKYWTWPNAVVGSVLLASGILYLMDRVGIGPSVKSRVRNWLDSSSFGIQTIQDANELHFVMTDNIGLRTDILQVKPDSPITIVSANHTGTPEQLVAFKALEKTQQDAFWRNVRLELLRYGIQFSNLSLEGKGVAFSVNVVIDRRLNASEFLQRILFVRSGARLYWELLLALGEASPSSILPTVQQSPNIPSSYNPAEDSAAKNQEEKRIQDQSGSTAEDAEEVTPTLTGLDSI